MSYKRVDARRLAEPEQPLAQRELRAIALGLALDAWSRELLERAGMRLPR